MAELDPAIQGLPAADAILDHRVKPGDDKESFANILILYISFRVRLLGNMAVPAQEGPSSLGASVDLREEVHDRFIFVFTADVPASEVSGRANALARASGGRLTHLHATALKGFAAKMPGDAAARVAAQNSNIAYYEPDTIAFAFPKPSGAGGGKKDTGCSAEQAPWGITRAGGSVDGTGLTAWVIDTGIDPNYPDLNVDVARSANVVSRGKDSPDDGHGHGTHVAGTIAALDNECDVVGVAAGATVGAVRVLDNSGSGSYAGMTAGAGYVAAKSNPGDMANMSLGGLRSQALSDAVEGVAGGGVLFPLAAGNSSDDTNNHSPATAEHSNKYTLPAIDPSDTFAWFFNYGDPPLDCAAPGFSILSTKKGGGTTTYSGTSMAAPHVAGSPRFGVPLGLDNTAAGDPDDSPDAICHY
jgi:subtilisin family serine protease